MEASNHAVQLSPTPPGSNTAAATRCKPDDSLARVRPRDRTAIERPHKPARPSTVASPLDDYIRAAIRANLSLAQDQLDEDHAVAAVREARSLRFPSLAFSSRRTQVDGGLDLGNLVNPAYRALNQITGTSSFPTNIGLTLPFAQETRVRLAQPIYQPAIGAGIRATDAARDAQSAAVRAATRQLAAQVQTSYWAVASADRVAELLSCHAALVDENVRVNERMLANGSATPDAVLRARADRSEVAQQLAEAEQERASARRAFNMLLDRPFDAPVTMLPDSALDVVAGLTRGLTLDELIRHALAGRDELHQAESAIAAATAQEKSRPRRFSRRFPSPSTMGCRGTPTSSTATTTRSPLPSSWSGTCSTAGATKRVASRRRSVQTVLALRDTRSNAGPSSMSVRRTTQCRSRAAPSRPHAIAGKPPDGASSWWLAVTPKAWRPDRVHRCTDGVHARWTEPDTDATERRARRGLERAAALRTIGDQNKQISEFPMISIPRLGFAALVFTVTACSTTDTGGRDTTVATGDVSAAIPVRLAPVTDDSAPQPVTATGVIALRDEVTLSFKIGGVVAQVLVREGESVRAGQLLATLDLREIDAQVAKARSAAAKTERDLARVTRLYNDSVATRQQMDDAATGAEVARADLETATVNQQYARIVAPSNGVILRRTVEPGELVSTGTPVLTLGSRTSGTIMRVSLPDRDIVRVRLGDPATLRVDARSDRAIQGVCARLAQPRTRARVPIPWRSLDEPMA